MVCAVLLNQDWFSLCACACMFNCYSQEVFVKSETLEQHFVFFSLFTEL